MADQWMHFSDFLALADIRGVDPIDAARELLVVITSPRSALCVFGLRRQWETPVLSLAARRAEHDIQSRIQLLGAQIDELEPGDPCRVSFAAEADRLAGSLTPDEERERLPRDPHLRPISRSVWDVIDTVDDDGTSEWIDHPDEPDMWTRVDWFGGRIDLRDWDMKRIEYNAIRIDRDAAFDILDRLSVGGVEAVADTSPIDRPLDMARARELAIERETMQRRAPRLSDPRLEEWWDLLTFDQKELPNEVLEKLATDSFPDNHVARERVRALIKRDFPDRKPGPRNARRHFLPRVSAVPR